LARAAECEPWIQLEVTPDPRYLLPDAVETLKAAEILLKEGFIVLPYIQIDPILAKRLEDIGVATVMPLGSPIGSNRGIRTRDAIEIIIEGANIPVVVDAGPRLAANNIKAVIQPSRLAQNPFCARL
jgi:thiazole synthase